MGPSGGGWSPNRFTSALLNGRSQAKPLARTFQVRRRQLVASITSGNRRASAATSSYVAMPFTLRLSLPHGAASSVSVARPRYRGDPRNVSRVDRESPAEPHGARARSCGSLSLVHAIALVFA